MRPHGPDDHTSILGLLLLARMFLAAALLWDALLPAGLL
jgi:hypothetical protein